MIMGPRLRSQTAEATAVAVQYAQGSTTSTILVESDIYSC